MELSKELPIFEVIEKYKEQINENHILEITLNSNGGKYTEAEFINFTNTFNSLKYKEKIEKECLCVSTENIELFISGMQHIIKYCHSDSHNTDAVCNRKSIVLSDKISDLFDDSISFSLYSNNKISVPDNWEDISKHYKMMKQIKYSLDDSITFITNIYKSSSEDYYTMKQSNVLKKEQQYEFKVMITKPDVNIIQQIVILIRAIHLSNMIITKEQQKKVLNDYHNMVKGDIEVSAYNKRYNNINLIAPKPVTLEIENLIDPKIYGATSILSEYTVTEKADGERILMYVNGSGEIYLINNSLNVEYTGMSVSSAYYNSLVDGEFIKCNKRTDGNSKDMYAAFDIYYIGNKLITSWPLIDDKNSRYTALQQFGNNISNGDIQFIVKEHKYSKNVLKDSEQILMNPKSFPYEIDGLIFTPAKLAVYSYYTNKPVKITDNVKWDRVFKWKPDEQNTIDFLINIGKTITKNGIKYKEVKLYVGYNASQWEDFNIETALKIRYDKDFSKEYERKSSNYIPILFKPKKYYSPGIEIAHVKIDSHGELRAINGDKIENNSIIEFRYNNDSQIQVNERWQPIRVREDKTRIYQKGILSKTANDFGVALNIWRSIHNPVTSAMIMGNEEMKLQENVEDLESDDIYYSRNIPRDNLLSVHMLNFHNQGIKRYLYMNATKKKGSLLELCCGDGGDMNRWIDSGYNFILGIDFVKHNIYNPISGGYSRMLRRRKQFMRKVQDNIYFPNMVFTAGDCSVPIRNGECAKSINDADSEKMLKIVMNKQHTYEKHLKHVTGKGAYGFDAVSCMFAIHYFFESEDKLNGFLSNVSENLKHDGVFFCTFMNGEKVNNEIMKNGGDKIEGIKLKTESYSGMPVWAIIRRYSKDNKADYGRKIDVYIENTKKLIPEYVVSFNKLVEKAREHNLELVKSEMFEETFNKLKKETPESDRLYEDLFELDGDDIQKQFSFLNQWAIFKKV